MNKFLEEFTYKIEIGLTVFLIGFGVTLLMAIVTVGYKSIKSAIANPVNSLRSE
jgi:putative ABC transport system permease protein